MKRFFCLMMTACLLMGLLPPPSASAQERYEEMDALIAGVYENGALMLAEEIEYAYVSTMDEPLNDAYSVGSLIRSMGIMDFGFEHDYEHRRAKLTDLVYYPGFRIARSWAMGRTDQLSEQEKAVLRQAEQMVSEARSEAQTDYDLLIGIHDRLIARVTYELGTADWTDLDTAVGALLNGRADCDGYADAFYLLGTLAGFDVRLQYGRAQDVDGTELAHQWNLIEWNGQWYHIDATWDDVNFDLAPSAVCYPYFLLGSGMMGTHSWAREMSVCEPAEQTDGSLFYYTRDPSGMTCGAYCASMEDAAGYAAYMQTTLGRDKIHVMLDGDQMQNLQQLNELLAESGMQGQWYLWGRVVSEYTCLSITILE